MSRFRHVRILLDPEAGDAVAGDWISGSCSSMYKAVLSAFKRHHVRMDFHCWPLFVVWGAYLGLMNAMRCGVFGLCSGLLL